VDEMNKMWLRIQYLLCGAFFLPGTLVFASDPVFLPQKMAAIHIVSDNPVALKQLKAATLWYEDFDGGLPEGWLNVDESGYCGFAHTYSGPQGIFSQGVPAINSSTAHNGFMMLDSDLCNESNAGGLTNAYIESPAINLSGHTHVMLSFQHFFRYCCSPESTQLVVEVSIDGQNWVSFDVKNGVWPNNLSPNAVHQLVNISEVAADQPEVKIRFRKIGASHYFWMIDDVAISSYAAHDLELFAVNAGDYTMIPGGQQQPVQFGGIVRNLGASPQTQIILNVTVNGSLFSDESLPYSHLNSGQTASLTIANAFDFTGRGEYHISFEARQNEHDNEPENNLALKTVFVTDTIFARDQGVYSGVGIRSGKGQAFTTGNLFYIAEGALATSVSVAFHQQSISGAAVTARLYTAYEGVFDLVHESQPYTLSNGDISFMKGQEPVWVTIPLNETGFSLNTGKQYLVAISYDGGDQDVVIASEIPSGFQSQGSYSLIGNTWQSESVIPMVRLNLGQNQASCAYAYAIETTQAYCGTASGQAIVEPLVGLRPFSYLWHTQPQHNEAFVSDLEVGQYVVEVWDASGCYDTIVVNIESQNLEMNSASVPSWCGAPNGEATVIPIAGFAPYDFVWDTNPPQTGQTATGLTPGTYSVMVTDSIGCQGILEVVVEENETLMVETQVQNPVCVSNNGHIVLEPFGGNGQYDFIWHELPDLNQNMATELPAGTYNITVTDQMGCESHLQIELAFEENEILITGEVISETCEQSNASIIINLEGAASPVNYFWANGANESSLENLGEGIYSVRVVDAFGCEAEANFTINNQGLMPRVSSFTSNSPGCGQSGGTALIIPQNPAENLVYEWSTGETSPNIENVPAGLYSVTIYNPEENCVLEYPVLINDAGALAIAASVTPILCHGDSNGAITVSLSGESNNPVFSWFHGPQGQTITDLGAGTYIVSISDGDCFTSRKFELNQPDLLRISYNLENIHCHGETANLYISPVGGTSPYSFYWNNGQTGTALENLPGGSYWVQITDFHECIFTQSFSIVEPPELIVEVEMIIPDDGMTNGSICLNVSGGIGSYTYSWNTGDTIACIDGLAAGTYSVTITDENNCDEYRSFNLSPTAITQYDELRVTAYPNPTSDYIWVQIDGSFEENLLLMLYDLNGKLVHDFSGRQAMASDLIRLDVSGLPQGIYLLHIKGTNVNSRLKLIKQ
jgi:hypothetical protein